MDYELSHHRGVLVGESAMPKHKLSQVFEFKDGEIGGECSLFSFFSHYADPNICDLNHANIIASIPNSQYNFASVFFHSLRNHSFLCGWDSAADDSGCFSGDSVEEVGYLM